MKAKLVKESLNFKRNLEPKDSMGTGGIPKELALRMANISTDELKEQWAVCFEVEKNWGGDVVFGESDFIFKTIEEFFADEDFMTELKEKLSEDDYWPEEMEIFTQPGIITYRPEMLLVFFEVCDEYETYLYGFDALTKEKYDEYLKNEQESEEEEDDEE